MQFVLSDQNDICLLEKERVRIKSSKNLNGQLFLIFFAPKYLVVRRTTRSQIVVVLTHFLVVEDTRTRKFCYPVYMRELVISLCSPNLVCVRHALSVQLLE